MLRVLIVLLFFMASVGVGYAGVTVAGVAAGIEPVRTLSYDKSANEFTLNGNERIHCPVTSSELLEIISALRLDDRFGVSVKLNNELIVYGKVNKKDKVAKKLEATDNFFRGIVFAEMSMLRGHKLPGDYQPKSPRSRSRASVILFTLDGFEFSKTGESYYPSNVVSKVILVPMAKYSAPDGGYLPDYDALEKGDFQPEDKENTDHINQHKQEYLAMDIVADSIRVGQAAALVRFFRQCGINLDGLYASVEVGDGKTLQGNPVSLGGQTAQTIPLESGKTQQEVAAPKQDYSKQIELVLQQDEKFGAEDKVKLSPLTVNDGSYVKFRREYLKNIEQIDVNGLPEDFVAAFKTYGRAWDRTLEWMEGQKIERTKESVEDFQSAHAPFRKELRDTYDKCKEIAAKYGVKVK